MEQSQSKFRIRKVRERMQSAAREGKSRRPLYDSDLSRLLMAAVAWAIGFAVVAYPVWGEWNQMMARGFTLFVVGAGCHMLLKVSSLREQFPHGAWLLLLAMLLVALVDARVAGMVLQKVTEVFGGQLGEDVFVAPHAFVPLLVAMIYGGQTAFIVGLMAGLAVALLGGLNLVIFIMVLIATIVISSEAPNLRYPAQIARTLGKVALWQLPVVLIKLLLESANLSFETALVTLAVMLLWLTVEGLMVVVFLPLAERLTRRVSDYTLTKFADLGRPLLRRLALEAPGTYHHSMMVADLSQAASDRIGANGLQARVGSYYHDIGKLGRPQFYAENQMYGSNPHDELPPNISRMMIVNHVKEGLVLARIHHLPELLTRFIATHHGTSVIRWFHHKALQEADEDGAGGNGVDESHYRYSGPLPVSREEAIVSLADSIEAASRSMKKVTPKHIENLVAMLCRYKWEDGQLDASVLSNKELAQVRGSFVKTLTHLLHGRLAYPDDERDKSRKQAATEED